jgi:uncharacterized cupredoxin-like copper-binding protein
MISMKTRFLTIALTMSILMSAPLVHAHGDQPIDPNMKVDNPIQAPEMAFGHQGVTREVVRTVDITVSDQMRFNPDSITVKQGETLRLHIQNPGKLAHEFVLGTKSELTEHAQMMRAMPGMAQVDPGSVRLAPGASTDLIWQFSKPGTFFYACLIPGHWEAGMQGTVTVAAAQAVDTPHSTATMGSMRKAEHTDMKEMPATMKVMPGDAR